MANSTLSRTVLQTRQNLKRQESGSKTISGTLLQFGRTTSNKTDVDEVVPRQQLDEIRTHNRVEQD